MYVWCPDELRPAKQESVLSGDTIYLSVNDLRLLTENVKEKCSSQKITESITSLLKESFPNSHFEKFENLSDSNSKGIKLEVDLISYYSEFYTAAWKGKTEINVSITDYRNGFTEPKKLKISESNSNANFGGMRTAKNNLRKSYTKAAMELLSFINMNV